MRERYVGASGHSHLVAELELFDMSWSSSLSRLKFLFYLMNKTKGLPLKLCEAEKPCWREAEMHCNWSPAFHLKPVPGLSRSLQRLFKKCNWKGVTAKEMVLLKNYF